MKIKARTGITQGRRGLSLTGEIVEVGNGNIVDQGHDTGAAQTANEQAAGPAGLGIHIIDARLGGVSEVLDAADVFLPDVFRRRLACKRCVGGCIRAFDALALDHDLLQRGGVVRLRRGILRLRRSGKGQKRHGSAQKQRRMCARDGH